MSGLNILSTCFVMVIIGRGLGHGSSCAYILSQNGLSSHRPGVVTLLQHSSSPLCGPPTRMSSLPTNVLLKPMLNPSLNALAVRDLFGAVCFSLSLKHF